MTYLCYNCGKESKDVLFMVQAGENYLCSECIDSLSLTVEDYLMHNDESSNKVILMPEESLNCHFCKQSTDIFSVKYQNGYICLSCLKMIYEIGLEYGFTKYKKAIKNLNKIKQIIKSKLNAEQKFNLICKSRFNLLKGINTTIQNKIKAIIFTLPIFFVFAFIFNYETMTISKSFLYLFRILLFYFFVGIGSMTEIKGIKNLLTECIHLNNSLVKKFAKRNIIMMSVSFLVMCALLIYYNFFLHIKSLVFLYFIPVIFLSIFLFRSVMVYKTPEKLFDIMIAKNNELID